MKKLLYLFLFFSLASLGAQPNLANLKFNSLSIQDGLSAGTVTCICQDSKGFMWFGTYDGLNKFDGDEITIYKAQDSHPGGISGNAINDIHVDQNGNLWVGSKNGLDLYDYAGNRFHKYRAPDTLDTYIGDIHETPDGEIFVSGFNHIYKVNTRDSSYFEFATNVLRSQGIDLFGIHKILIDRLGILWIAMRNDGVLAFNPETNEARQFNVHTHALLSNTIHAIIEDFNGNLWFGTDQGINILEFRTETFKSFQIDPCIPTGSGDKICWSLLQDCKGNIWVGTTENGLIFFNKAENKFSHFRHDKFTDFSLNDNSIQSLYEDKQGHLWVGTLQGVNLANIQSENFHTYRVSPGSHLSLSHNLVTAFGEDRSGNIWIGTDGGGLNYFDRARQEFRHYLQDPHSLQKKNMQSILAILMDRHENLWVGGFSAGLALLDKKGSLLMHFQHDSNDPTSLSNNDVRSIFEDHQGNLWVATNGKGLNRLINKSQKIFKRYLHDPSDPDHSLVDDYCLTIAQDSDSMLWIGTYNGLSMFDSRDNRFKNFRVRTNDTTCLSDNWIYAIHEDAKRNLWVGTSKGLNLLIRDRWHFARVNPKKGNLNEVINGILEDDRGYLWLSTNKGLAQFHPDSQIVRNYTILDGLQSDQFSHGAFLQLKSGEMLFGGVNGFNLFHPDSIGETFIRPQIVITGLKFFNQPMLARTRGSPLKKHISETDEVKLSHKQATFFTIEYTGLEYLAPERIQYRYRLEGYHDDWIFAGKNRSATFTNLDAGKYTFRVSASNFADRWNEPGAILHIQVSPPLWLSWWAYLSYGFLAVLLIWGYHRYSTKLMHLKMDLKLQKMEKEKACELESLQSQFFTHISHEFRAPISLILVPLKEIIQNGPKKKWSVLQEQFQLMQRSAERLLRLVNQILDFNKIESGRLQLQKKQVELIGFIRAILDTFTLLAAENNITLSLKSDRKNIYCEIDPEKMDMVIYNLLSNAFKFTPAGGEIIIRIQQISDTWIEMSVQDSGIGIPSEHLEHVFERFYYIKQPGSENRKGAGIGLSLTKQIIELHEGRISAQSEDGRGTCFEIELPIGATSIHKAPEPADQGANEQEPDDHVRKSKKQKRSVMPRLLLVEDDQELRRYLNSELRADYQIIEAADGKTALSIAKEKIPDLIISDVMMCEMDGISLCKNLKMSELTGHIPIIMLTARDSDIHQIEGLEIGVDDYITKPFNLHVLKLKIRNLLETRRCLRERFSREFRLEPEEIVLTSADEMFLNRAIKIIEEYMADGDFNVELFGQKMGLSRSQLFRKIKALTAETPVEFVQAIRLQRAAQLLKKSKLTITEICYEVGFNFPSHFSKLFIQKYGLSPKEYRKKNFLATAQENLA